MVVLRTCPARKKLLARSSRRVIPESRQFPTRSRRVSEDPGEGEPKRRTEAKSARAICKSARVKIVSFKVAAKKYT